jgi:hypothetical protein
MKSKSAREKKTRRVAEQIVIDMYTKQKPIDDISHATGLSLADVRLIVEKTF